MALYWDQMFNTAGESTTLAQANPGTTASVGPYHAKKPGKLLKVVIFQGYEAASSLVEDVRFEITCTDWTPNTLMFDAAGDGLHTAPHFHGAQSIVSYDVDQPVQTQTDITANYIHDSGSPVTSRLRVMGLFQA